METNIYTQLLKEQKKLRSRLVRKGQRVRELEDEKSNIMACNFRNSEMYRLERMRADNLQKKNYLITFYSKIIVYSLIASLLTNLYFIFK